MGEDEVIILPDSRNWMDRSPEVDHSKSYWLDPRNPRPRYVGGQWVAPRSIASRFEIVRPLTSKTKTGKMPIKVPYCVVHTKEYSGFPGDHVVGLTVHGLIDLFPGDIYRAPGVEVTWELSASELRLRPLNDIPLVPSKIAELKFPMDERCDACRAYGFPCVKAGPPTKKCGVCQSMGHRCTRGGKRIDQSFPPSAHGSIYRRRTFPVEA